MWGVAAAESGGKGRSARRLIGNDGLVQLHRTPRHCKGHRSREHLIREHAECPPANSREGRRPRATVSRSLSQIR